MRILVSLVLLGFVKVLTLANLIGMQCYFIISLICPSPAEVDHVVSYLFLLLLMALSCRLLIWKLSYLSFFLEYLYRFWILTFLFSLGSFVSNELIFRMVLSPLALYFLFIPFYWFSLFFDNFTYIFNTFCLLSLLSSLCQSSLLPTVSFPHSYHFVLWPNDLTRIIRVTTGLEISWYQIEG